MGRIKRFFKNLSIQKTLIVYTVVFMLIATFLSMATYQLLDKWDNEITRSYSIVEESTFSDAKGREVVLSLVTEEIEFSKQDQVLMVIISIVRVIVIPLYYGGLIILAAFLFFRQKLRKPIEQINEAAMKIADNNLDFSLSYDSKDEMGKLCSSLETMRAALENNNREMWRMMEERKRLNAVFSHDLRTPLTILRGYSDFLNNYLPQGKMQEKQILSTISAISKHTARLESYVEAMNAIQSLEEISICEEEIRADDLYEQLIWIVEMLEKESMIQINVENNMIEKGIMLDMNIILRVMENLLANALRFAKAKIEVSLNIVNEKLIIGVSDDGNGFSQEELKKATNAFYRNNNVDNTHFGLGLFICKTLCEKHGGELRLKNNKAGGAKIVASFLCKNR